MDASLQQSSVAYATKLGELTTAPPGNCGNGQNVGDMSTKRKKLISNPYNKTIGFDLLPKAEALMRGYFKESCNKNLVPISVQNCVA